MASHKGDPVNWMKDALKGKDSLKVSEKIAVGIVMTHGDFPKCKDPTGTWGGYPIEGITPENEGNICFQQVMLGEVPRVIGGKLVREEMICTAGTYAMVVTGTGTTVSGASKAAMKTVKELSWPSNVMHRTDIGKRLKKHLPMVQKHGFARGMDYGQS